MIIYSYIKYSMFSPNAEEYTKLVELAFIAGVGEDNLKKYIDSFDVSVLKPECLVSFPHETDLVSDGILEVI